MPTAERVAAGPQQVDVLGVKVSAIDMPMALETIERWIESGAREYICVTGVHGVMESQRDAALLEIHNRAGLVTPDGMPLVWVSHARGMKHVRRVYGPDLLQACSERAATNGWRFFFYGGANGVPELLARRLSERYPGLRIAGTYSPPFRALTEQEDAEIVRRINHAVPDIVWVGLSTPKQERWMAAHVGRLHAAALIGVGAAFDFHSGLKRQAPRWIQRSGLEWLYRFYQEPRRLWRRYALLSPLFVGHLALQITGMRRYDTTSAQAPRKKLGVG